MLCLSVWDGLCIGTISVQDQPLRVKLYLYINYRSAQEDGFILDVMC
jgi:hypothetical protein